MKKLLILLVIIFSFGFNQVEAQKSKFGHIDSNELMEIMPGKDTAQAQIQAYATILQKQLETMSTEFETKYTEYIANEANMPELMKSTKQEELQDLQARIESFQQKAQDDLIAKEQLLLQPIIDRAKELIAEVAKEKGYSYVFDTGQGGILYFEETEDILPAVKLKLGNIKNEE
jgi:outer membrane protein